MTRLLTLAFLCLAVYCAQAQSSKQKLGFIPYSDPAADKYGYRQMAYDNLYEAATRIFINTQRFDVLDRSKFDILKLEKNFTKGDDFINSEIVTQGKSLAAEVLAVAKVTALSVTQSEDKKGWAAFFTVEFKQIDVESSKALNAVQLKGEAQDEVATISVGETKMPNPNRAKSPEQAISKAVTKMEETLNKWIRDNFPIKMKVLEINEAQKILYARGGKDFGITTKSKMCIRRIHKLSTGDPIADTIAELKFTDDGVGDTATKFQPKIKKDWESIVKALADYPNEVFIMESVIQGTRIGPIRL